MGRNVRVLTVDKVGQHDADCDHDLEETGDSTSDLLWRAFGDEGGGDCRDCTDTDTCDDSTCIDVAYAARTPSDGLKDLRNRALGMMK